MPITAWKPSTQISRGNVSVGIATAMADINSPKATELNVGTGLECSIQTFNGTSSADSKTIDWLCDPNSENLPGSITHSIDDLVIKTTGQADASLVTALAIGTKIYIWRRDGKAVATAPTIGDFVWVWEAVVTSIDPLEANSDFIGITAHVQVYRRTKTAIALT